MEATPQLDKDGGQVILLAAPDEAVRQHCGDCLKNQGYSVIRAENGLLAWKLFQEFRDVIDLLVVDQELPLMAGMELAGSARGIKPGLSVLLTSGDPHGREQLGRLLDEHTRMLAKPFDPDALIHAVRDLLKH